MFPVGTNVRSSTEYAEAMIRRGRGRDKSRANVGRSYPRSHIEHRFERPKAARDEVKNSKLNEIHVFVTETERARVRGEGEVEMRGGKVEVASRWVGRASM